MKHDCVNQSNRDIFAKENRISDLLLHKSFLKGLSGFIRELSEL